jgi:hypothetical protein
MCDNRTQAQKDEAAVRKAVEQTRRLWERYQAISQAVALRQLADDTDDPVAVGEMVELLAQQWVTLTLLLGISEKEKRNER